VFQTLLTADAVGTRTWEQLLEGSDGMLYAIAGNKLVRVDRNGTGFQVIHTNQTSSFGPSQPDLLLEGANGDLYVTETSGGDSLRGVIYRIKKDGSGLVTVLDYGGMSFEQGSNPHQLIQGSDGAVYGVAVSLNQDGSFPTLGSPVFRVNPDGSDYTIIGRLQNYPVQGPSGTLREGGNATSLFAGRDGFLYGATQNGSTNRAGALFRVSKEGDSFAELLAFPASYLTFDAGAGVNRTPAKFLVEGTDGRIHGTALNNLLFRFSPEGTGFETTFDFPASSTGGTNLQATLAVDAAGWIYGSTANGGAGGSGTIFRLRTDGTAFSYLHQFTNSQEGSLPLRGVIAATDGKLYGTCYSNGVGAVGTIFRMEKDGAGFEVLRAFLSTGGDGRFPVAPLLEGSDGSLYGTTFFGGGAAVGCLFRLNKDGSNFAILHRFTNSISGANPSAALIQGHDGRLYGTAETNGPGGEGVVFAIGTNGSSFTILHSFSSTIPGLRKPQGALLQSATGTLFGTAADGGGSGFGGVFSLEPDGTGFQVLHEFSSAGGDGRVPVAGLAFGGDGNLYGVTQFGGGFVNGSIFQLAQNNSGYVKLRAFTGTNGDGGNPVGALVPGPDGALYGTTSAGGDFNSGSIFRLALSTPGPSLSADLVAGPLLRLKWPSSGSGFRLQANPEAANPLGWQSVPTQPVLTNGGFELTIAPVGQMFFRLIKP
jgi:uncharacterized repeat protein (TIGR03803 family)